MIKFAVCDDERDMTDYISNKLREYYPNECEIKEYTDSESLLDDSKHEFFDAYFLDIGMPSIDGFELARQIRVNDPHVKIIFVTEKEELAHLGYIYGAFRFIRKSNLDQELKETVNSLNEVISASDEYLSFRGWTGNVLINIKAIRYFKGDGHFLILHAMNEERICGTMKALENRLKGRGFIRIHKSYLVNIRFFCSINSTSVKLWSGEQLPISRNKIYEVRKRVNQCCQVTGEL